MKIALFHNFTEETFVCSWDGKKHTFKPGQKKYMQEYLARHFAKHLTNQVLIENGKENYTSPKKPEEVPQFMEIFNKAFFMEKQEDEDETTNEVDVINKNKEAEKAPPTVVDNKPPQTIGSPDSDKNPDFDEEG